uniref:Uncharacterized protein n=1 Tax=Brassica oleracea var. oleracea TaxID=109376 RepID=A0A0D3AHN4_BRAOL
MQLVSARDMAQKTVIGKERIVYSTERDMIEQDYEAEEWDVIALIISAGSLLQMWLWILTNQHNHFSKVFKMVILQRALSSRKSSNIGVTDPKCKNLMKPPDYLMSFPTPQGLVNQEETWNMGSGY